MATSVQEDIKSYFDKTLSVVPEELRGMDVVQYLINLVYELPSDERKMLRNHIEEYLNRMQKVEASDVDLGGDGCNGKVWYRIHGTKKAWEKSQQYTLLETNLLILNLLSDEQMEHLVMNRSIDFSYSLSFDRDRRYRATVYFDMDNLAMNMRQINNEIRPFSGLNLHPEVARHLSLKYLKYGLTLVTGITGSGKSTTLDTIIDANNRSVRGHIVIVASPIELVHKPQKCIIRHREVGKDVASFRDGIVQAMRQDPDIVVIGELRDDVAIRNALEVTDSGHKVFSTLHTASAMESIDRIIGETPLNEQERVRVRLADVLTCVISQKLINTLEGTRVLAKEVLLATPPVRAAIKNNNVSEIYQMLNEGGQFGMHTLEQDLVRLVNQRIISPEEAINQANNKTRIKQLLR
ncbi:type IV pilus twitching motility protein PilT [Rhodohalobacter sp. 614A]|uniref:type IV pilus twitching motility protein PilT n=1 Tax=Rhodohalobacter sp. 614A TaxID=2908649 RepID=UPI001F24ECDF|nr:ATPase, T2SS/T4P/T4SS family [Rhodohalobacter sp. 614A]